MWELYTGEDAFQRLLHPGQFFETVVLQDLRPVIPQGEKSLGSMQPAMCLMRCTYVSFIYVLEQIGGQKAAPRLTRWWTGLACLCNC